MRKEIAKKWIKALRSGKYKQGQDYLKQYNSKGEPRHCCLGVLCELYNNTMKKNHKKTLYTKDIDHHDIKVTLFDTYDGVLPTVVKKWAGMSDVVGNFSVIEKDGSFKDYSLTEMNDAGKKFGTIADMIEKNMENI